MDPKSAPNSAFFVVLILHFLKKKIEKAKADETAGKNGKSFFK
jgi:hypothetical protein